MSDTEKTLISSFTTPFKRQEVELSALKHENGLNLLEVRIREGRRFTMLELDAELALEMAKTLQDWAEKNGQS